MNLHLRTSMSGRKTSAYSVADQRVDAVARHDEVVVAARAARRRRTRVWKRRSTPSSRRALLQEQQQPHAADAAEAVAARDGAHAMVDRRRCRPSRRSARGSRRRSSGRCARRLLERLVGQHDAPAERVVGRVALEHDHLVRGIAQLHRDREVEPGRPTTEASNPHGCAPSLPVSWDRAHAPLVAAAANSFKHEASCLNFCNPGFMAERSFRCGRGSATARASGPAGRRGRRTGGCSAAAAWSARSAREADGGGGVEAVEGGFERRRCRGRRGRAGGQLPKTRFCICRRSCTGEAEARSQPESGIRNMKR